MAYNYLIELYELTDNRLKEARSKLEGGESESHNQGRIDFLQEFEDFLNKNYYKMLPGKIRNRIEKHGIDGIN